MMNICIYKIGIASNANVAPNGKLVTSWRYANLSTMLPLRQHELLFAVSVILNVHS